MPHHSRHTEPPTPPYSTLTGIDHQAGWAREDGLRALLMALQSDSIMAAVTQSHARHNAQRTRRAGKAASLATATRRKKKQAQRPAAKKKQPQSQPRKK